MNLQDVVRIITFLVLVYLAMFVIYHLGQGNKPELPKKDITPYEKAFYCLAILRLIIDFLSGR